MELFKPWMLPKGNKLSRKHDETIFLFFFINKMIIYFFTGLFIPYNCKFSGCTHIPINGMQKVLRKVVNILSKNTFVIFTGKKFVEQWYFYLVVKFLRYRTIAYGIFVLNHLFTCFSKRCHPLKCCVDSRIFLYMCGL